MDLGEGHDHQPRPDFLRAAAALLLDPFPRVAGVVTGFACLQPPEEAEGRSRGRCASRRPDDLPAPVVVAVDDVFAVQALYESGYYTTRVIN